MYQGKYANRKSASRRRRRSRKPTLLLAAMLVLLVAVIGTTVAYLTSSTGTVTNEFKPVKLTTPIVEEFENGVKNNVTVKNNGDINAYVRAAVVVTWKDAEGGNVHPSVPVAGTDYTVTIPVDARWIKVGDYYYYNEPLAPGASTGVLLTNCQAVAGQAPEGYALDVTILVSAIQSEPDTAINTAWGIQIKDGKVGTFTAAQGGNEE